MIESVRLVAEMRALARMSEKTSFNLLQMHTFAPWCTSSHSKNNVLLVYFSVDFQKLLGIIPKKSISLLDLSA